MSGTPLADWRILTLGEGRAALRLCNSYNRLPTIIALAPSLEISDWLTILGEEWECCDNIGQFTDDLIWSDPFGCLLDDPEQLRGYLMDSGEQAAFDALPDDLTIYRGCYAINKWGLSWTTDRAIAERFPTLHRYRQDGPSLLVTARVRKADILAVKGGRDEAEIICYRPKHISTQYIRAPISRAVQVGAQNGI